MKEQVKKLDPKKIIENISAQNRRCLSHLFLFDTIDSTNTYLLTQVKKPEARGSYVCIAEQQTQGRGRQGKVWDSSSTENIYLSLSWRFPKFFAETSSLGVAVAVMVIKALARVGLQQDLQLKWPNDVFYAGKKIAGILLEGLIAADHHEVVIGIGLNLTLPNAENSTTSALAQALDAVPSRHQMAGILIDELYSGLKLFCQKGLKPFIAQYRALDYLANREVTFTAANATSTGTAEGINNHGQLIFKDTSGAKLALSYGEVSVSLK
jgi:BirA family biotin operon repressor/biotin-[acetyl-CoA-carboxylase] ligase